MYKEMGEEPDQQVFSAPKTFGITKNFIAGPDRTGSLSVCSARPSPTA